jgi:hypothetical protein
MVKMFVTLTIVLSAGMLAGAESLTTPSGNATWQGWLQCQVTVQGAGYSNRQTHVDNHTTGIDADFNDLISALRAVAADSRGAVGAATRQSVRFRTDIRSLAARCASM